MSQQYSLRWNNHQPNFISMFETLLTTKTLVDVTLAAEGQHLVAHKVVLSACSTYFHSLFVDNPSHHPIVILKDVTFADLRTMVDFMYYGQVNVTEEQLPQVLETAKVLKIKGLTEMPDSTSLTRSSDYNSADNSLETQRQSASPCSPTRRKRRRKSSSGSVNCIGENIRNDEIDQNINMTRELPTVTLSSLPHKRRDDKIEETAQQTGEPSNLNIDLNMEANIIPQGQWSMLEYPRYTNPCLGGGALPPDQGMYINNVMNTHADADLNSYGQLGIAGPAPGPSCVADSQAVQNLPQTPVAKRRRTTNPQAEENFQRALEAVRFGGIGFCKAARLFGVNNRTLWLEYKKKGYPNNRPSIKSRIKREHVTPPPEHKDEPRQAGTQMAFSACPPAVPVGYIDTPPVGFSMQVGSTINLNLNGMNFPIKDVKNSGPGHILVVPSEKDETENVKKNLNPLSTVFLRQRRSKIFKRQCRVSPEEQEMKKQASEPAPAPSSAVPILQKHDSYPQYKPPKVQTSDSRRLKAEQSVGSLLIRAFAVVDTSGQSRAQTSTATPSVSSAEDAPQTQRASHTPAVRSGPPLSCNFCWNTVDECGRILRRKTQYHCPECRTNLCIVPCFHEYHDGPDAEASASAR
ncbi:uncharacterized protein LOC121738470 [Aricia agestis]|uniref:uncharacterized protein LOC121738470 n=1 Tax=Aricia agestis TaxID=91739 RepID=UPI001C2093BD|nr:uncharacterized protein LOC121738470 [Aricia agestis]